MMEIKKGDVVLCKAKGLLGYAIKLYTKTDYSHALFAISDNQLIEAWGTRVRIVPKSDIEKRDYDVYRYKWGLSNDQLLTMTDYAASQVGVSYDWSQLFGYLRYGLKKDNGWNTPNEMICSELVDNIFLAADIDLMPNKKMGDMTPDDLAKCDWLVKVNR